MCEYVQKRTYVMQRSTRMDKIAKADLRAAAALAIEMHEAGQVTINPETGTTSWTDLR